MPFNFQKLEIPEVIYIKPKIFEDPRGAFFELFKSSEFKGNGIEDDFIQANHSTSFKNSLRGLHYQKDPVAQAKLIFVVRGSIFDVAVDMRGESPTYGRWVSANLDSTKHDMLYIPKGFAHGFCVLSEVAEIIYYCSDEYSPANERGILWNDPTLAINWPVTDPILSERDQHLPPLIQADNNFCFNGR